MKEWEKLCKRYRSTKVERTHPSMSKASGESENDNDLSSEDELEVLKLVDICYGDPADTGKHGLKFKVKISHKDNTCDKLKVFFFHCPYFWHNLIHNNQCLRVLFLNRTKEKKKNLLHVALALVNPFLFN